MMTPTAELVRRLARAAEATRKDLIATIAYVRRDLEESERRLRERLPVNEVGILQGTAHDIDRLCALLRERETTLAQVKAAINEGSANTKENGR